MVYDDPPSASTQDLVARNTDVANVVPRDRAAWYGTAAIALGVVASNTCTVPAIGITGSFALGACVVSIAAAAFIAVGSIIQATWGNNKRGLDSAGPDYLRISGLDVERGSAHDFKWFYPGAFTPLHRESLEANYVEGDAPLLFGESNCDGPGCARLWYSHTRNATGDGGVRRRVEVSHKSVDLTRNNKRQDHESDESNDGLSGGYVWDEHDVTTLHSIATDDNFAADVVNQMIDQNAGAGGSGKFGKEGVYCMDLNTDVRQTPTGSDGYLWYYGDKRWAGLLDSQLTALMKI